MKNFFIKQVYKTLFYPTVFVVILWIIFFTQTIGNYNFTVLGVLPRETKGLFGIISSVFIHGNLNHIASNSIPLLVLGMMLFYFYKKIAKASFIWIWIISGIWLWIGGRNFVNHPTYHIGASTLIYGLASFLFFSGVFRKHLRLMVVSALVVFLYGGIVWGIFPMKQEISWEGHLFGALAGILVAFNYRKEGPQRRVYEWENETEEENNNDEPWLNVSDEANITSPQNEEVSIRYIYKEKNNENF